MAKLTARSRLGDWLVALGLVSRKSVKEALKSARPGELLGQTPVRTGVLERDLLEKVASIQRQFKQSAEKMPELMLDERSFIGDILVALGFISLETKQQWLDYQSEKRARGEDPGRLGELLVEHQVCSSAQRDLAMQVQNWLRGL